MHESLRSRSPIVYSPPIRYPTSLLPKVGGAWYVAIHRPQISTVEQRSIRQKRKNGYKKRTYRKFANAPINCKRIDRTQTQEENAVPVAGVSGTYAAYIRYERRLLPASPE